MNFLFHNVCLHKKRPDLQIHRHLNVKYYSAKAGLWPFVIILQYKVAKKKKYCLTAQKVRCIPRFLAVDFILYFRRSTIQPAKNIAKMISNFNVCNSVLDNGLLFMDLSSKQL